ncbi:MAG: bifunctional 2-polyprenyl-6-hydroxyphenol methylase/3-demethylubiquinol 3-O-methyltransferase UbiG [Pseudomonadota bacterium]
MPSTETTVDSAEIAKFEAMAAEWWDPRGKFAPLHRMNPIRLDYIIAQIAAEFGREIGRDRPFEDLKVADIGCGGGLLSEPLARLGADVTGADAGAENVAMAKVHADQMAQSIDYRVTTAEALANAGETFDAVLAMEIVEHVADPAAFLDACARLVRPGGLLVVSTLNRTAKSFAAAIVGAEYVLGWLPRGTHDWSRFLTPDELKDMIDATGMKTVDRRGMVYDPLRDAWQLSDRDLSVNYAAVATQGQQA